MKYFLLLALIGCSNDQSGTQPTPPITTEAGVPPLTQPPRRAFHRNPFGDIVQPDNLMLDGDFEITGRSGQAPWFLYSQNTLNYDTGGRCRSGIRCAVIIKGDSLIGYMASPMAGDIEVRVYLQPSSGVCADATVVTVDFSTGMEGMSLHSMTTAPDETGWCEFDADLPNFAYAQPGLYIQIGTKAASDSLHIDQASALPMSEVPFHGIKPPATPPPADVMARVKEASDYARAHRIYGRNAPRTQK